MTFEVVGGKAFILMVRSGASNASALDAKLSELNTIDAGMGHSENTIFQVRKKV